MLRLAFEPYVDVKRGPYAAAGVVFGERRLRLRSGSVKGFGRAWAWPSRRVSLRVARRMSG